ncbi:putative WRKY transcription factor 70, partial [Bidens hawaiensis]|uniref:putative WRKY transcription factor 70 n=1 Tax=Bidens hawaiensis TaxID=980011 RepID=UPI0040497887
MAPHVRGMLMESNDWLHCVIGGCLIATRMKDHEVKKKLSKDALPYITFSYIIDGCAKLQLDLIKTKYSLESSSWPESSPTNTRIKAIQELTKGENITNKLREMQGLPEITESDLKSDDGVVVQILGMFENTLLILGSPKINETCNNSTKDVKSPSSRNSQNSADSGESINTPSRAQRGCYKRRKNVLTTIEITSNLFDDGYAWRKYGQKTILNLKHQRNYYRCSHKLEQGCQATKQVQKINDEPSKYRITLSGLHTCNNLQRAPHIIVEDSSPKDNSVFINFETNRFTENHKVGTRFQSVKHTSKE